MDRLAPKCITRKIISLGKPHRKCAAVAAVHGTVVAAAQLLVQAVVARAQVDALVPALRPVPAAVLVAVLEHAPAAQVVVVDARVAVVAVARVVLGDNG